MGEKWVMTMKEELQSWGSETEAHKWTSRCIYRVPKKIRDLNPDAYNPSIVSLGPYHHGQGHLKLMEPHKRRAVFGFLCRSGRSLEEVVEAMREYVSEMMEAYEDLDDKWKDKKGEKDEKGEKKGEKAEKAEKGEKKDEKAEKAEKKGEKDEKGEKKGVNGFLELMVLDACFLVEMLIKLYDLEKEDYYYISDPVFNNRGFLSSLLADIFKLENQLPMGVLSILMQRTDKSVANYFQKCFVFEDEGCPDKNISAYHILDLQRQLMGREGRYYYDGSVPNRKTATELLQSGVQFKKSKTRCFKDITFKDGVLSLPTLDIQNDIEAWLLNLLAFEHLHSPKNNCGINSYALLMDSLINTEKDVELLREQKIITGLLGNDEEIAFIFNRLGRGFELFCNGSKMGMDSEVNANITEYCGRPTNKLRASFLQTYCTNPWVFFSVVGALVLLVLTILQTLYALLSYYNPEGSM